MKPIRALVVSAVVVTCASVASAELPSAPSVAAVAAPSPAVLERAKNHVLRPAHVTSVPARQERIETAGASGIVRATRPTPAAPRLHADKLGQAVHAFLKDRVRGYAMQIRRGGQPAHTLVWEWARTNEDGGKGWTLDSRMHVASVSKMLTAIAVVKMLDDRGLPFDTKIGPYLPSHWSPGPNAADITFRQLLTHSAGFTEGYYDGDYPTFKGQITAGVQVGAPSVYTNGAFSLLRVVGSTLTGAVPKNYGQFRPATSASLDQLWDVATIEAFQAYTNGKVFAPSGVTGVSPVPSPGAALAYSSKTDSAGWDSGDVATQLGGAGFRLSVNDVLDVMGTFRRKGKIVSPAKAQEALDAGLGVKATGTPAGKMYSKAGWWGSNKEGGWYNVEQCVAVFLPNDMEMVVFANSNVLTAQNGALYSTSLSESLLTAAANAVE